MDYRRPLEALIPDAQGRILGVLARTETELTMRTLAKVAGVSSTHASRLLPRLVQLGVVERRDVGSSALFRLAPRNLAARWVRAIASMRDQAIEELRASVAMLAPRVVNVTLFGSLARGDAGVESDVDVLVVLSDEPDAKWDARRGEWEGYVRELVGNPVNIIEVDTTEAARRLRARSGLWAAIAAEGICLAGQPVDELATKSRSRRRVTR